MIFDRWWRSACWGLLLLLAVPGCLLVGHTQYRAEILPDGAARVVVRYIDLRSDGETDSAVVRDLDILLDSFRTSGEGEHLPPGMLLVEKHLGLQGDTLVAEVLLEATDLADMEGFSRQNGLPTVIVPAGQQITWTNGAVSRWHEGGLRIQWSDTARSIEFDVQPTNSSGARTLAPLYRERHGPGGEQ